MGIVGNVTHVRNNFFSELTVVYSLCNFLVSFGSLPLCRCYHASVLRRKQKALIYKIKIHAPIVGWIADYNVKIHFSKLLLQTSF